MSGVGIRAQCELIVPLVVAMAGTIALDSVAVTSKTAPGLLIAFCGLQCSPALASGPNTMLPYSAPTQWVRSSLGKRFLLVSMTIDGVALTSRPNQISPTL